jgi:4-hydroxy-3-methylbut-2-en-1-yl diphosphate reductase
VKINLARSAGFCFGVERALTIALKTAASKARVCMLGDIVHNEDVVRKINERGIKKISKLCRQKGRILLIRAHGVSLSTLQRARRFGYKIVDATCPMVKEIHKITQEMDRKGYKIIVIGDRKHDEVQGIVGQISSKAIVIDVARGIPLKIIKIIDKACIVAQSTQNLEKVLRLVSALKLHIKDLEFFNTICMPTRMKQKEIKKMPLENDVMIIIGSKTSANTRRLYEISKSLNPHTYWVSSRKEIRRNWFRHVKSIGVTAGASTPDSTTSDVVKYLRQMRPRLRQ